MLSCWEWDSAQRPAFTEIRIKLNELFGESCSNTFENKTSVEVAMDFVCSPTCRRKSQLPHDGQDGQRFSGQRCRVSV